MDVEPEISRSSRRSRGARRRPDQLPLVVERIPPRSGLSRAEVVANQRSRIFQGLAAALAYHGYEDTKITDIVELSGVSRATFYERFEGKEDCFSAAYDDGIERLVSAVEEAARGEGGWANQVSAGLRAGLEFLSADPPLAHLLFVESLAAARPARLQHEQSLEHLAEVLRPPVVSGQEGAVSEETARMLAGGVSSRLSGCILAGETERLSELHGTMLQFLLAPVGLPAVSAQRHAVRA